MNCSGRIFWPARSQLAISAGHIACMRTALMRALMEVLGIISLVFSRIFSRKLVLKGLSDLVLSCFKTLSNSLKMASILPGSDWISGLVTL